MATRWKVFRHQTLANWMPESPESLMRQLSNLSNYEQTAIRSLDTLPFTLPV